MMRRVFLVALPLCLIVLAFSSWFLVPRAESYNTLRIISPNVVAAAGSGLDANHRVFRAYAGIEYTIRITATGGKYPYTFSHVSGAPSGMTIDAGPCTANGTGCIAGTVTWTSPSAGTYSNITYRVTDSLGATVDAVWTLVVSTTACSNAGGFCFVDDATGNDSNNGDIGSPYKTLIGLKAARTGHQIVYVHTGTYLIDQTSSIWTWREDTSGPVIWLCYPGDTCTINWASTGGAEVSYLRFQGKNIYVDGFRQANVGSMGIQTVQTSRYGATYRNLRGLQLVDGENGMNSAFLMWVNADPGNPAYFNIIQNSIFSDIHGDGGIDNGDGGSTADDGCAIKLYNVKDTVIEDNEFNTSAFIEGVVAPKEEAPGTTIRNNKSASDVLTFVHSNFNNQSGLYESTSGEILYNLCLSTTGDCLNLATTKIAGSVIGVWDIYRNTFIGTVEIANLLTADGPYTFSDNVLLNAQAASGSCPAKYTCTSVTDYSRLVDNASNLKGLNDGSVANATTGLLINRALVGTVGFEFASLIPPVTISGNARFSGSVRIQ